MNHPSAVVATLVLLAGCTTTSEIIVDRKGVNMAQYEEDLADCESYAEQVRVGAKAGKGAASGAVVGGAIGAVDDHRETGEGAAVGAVLGGVKGLNEGERDKVRVVKNCLRGRGYRILN
jgi:outer membrane lipoprotein SlyB